MRGKWKDPYHLERVDRALARAEKAEAELSAAMAALGAVLAIARNPPGDETAGFEEIEDICVRAQHHVGSAPEDGK